MNRFVQYLNLIGVLALAVLCAVQWQWNRALNIEVNRLEKTHLAEGQKIEEQEKNIKGLTADLAILKEQVSQTHSNLTQARADLKKSETAYNQVILERDQLKESVTKWAHAVTIRDERIKEENQKYISMAERLNDSTHKYNTLASNYNSVVKQLNEARGQLEMIAAQQAEKAAPAPK